MPIDQMLNPWQVSLARHIYNTSEAEVSPTDAMLPMREQISPTSLDECTVGLRRPGSCNVCRPSAQRREAGWTWDSIDEEWFEPTPLTLDPPSRLREYLRNTSPERYANQSPPVVEAQEMPVDYETIGSYFYCEQCDARNSRRAMQTCPIGACGRTLCANCYPRHTHNGGWCEAHGYSMLDGATTTRCDTHGDFYCISHARQHVGCAEGGYEPRDDGRYTGRPPVDGFGREASLALLDNTYIEDDIVTHKRAAALELEVEYAGPRTGGARLYLPSLTGITHDGSLNNGIEVTTPPAKGRILRDIVESTCSILEIGGYEAQDTCGMHTHIDLRDYKDDKKFLSHLFNAFFAIEDILFAMQAEERHNSTFSVPLRHMYKFFDMYGQMTGDFDYTFYKQPKTFEGRSNIEAEKQGKYSGVRYAAFNFHSVYYRGSLECRIHEGSVNAEDALRWINLLQTVIARVERGHSYATMKKLAQMKVTTVKVAAFAKYFGLTKEQREWVASRIRGGHGFGWRLPYEIKWGIPRRGRPSAEPKIPRFRLYYVGQEVRCYNCGNQWILERRTTYCPECRRMLVDRYGGINYSRATVRTTGRRLPMPAVDEYDEISDLFTPLEDYVYEISPRATYRPTFEITNG